MKSEKNTEGSQSFIAEARRDQIVEAAVRTLDEIGYLNASLAQIAKRAGISTGLISYHFSDKHDLMDHVLMKLIDRSSSYILEKVKSKSNTIEKLEAFIVSSLAYQETHKAHNTALLEIIFNARTTDNIPYYKLSDDEDNPLLEELESILLEGQKQKIFGKFNTAVMCNFIQGAISENMLNNTAYKKIDLETYSRELVSIVINAIKRDSSDQTNAST